MNSLLNKISLLVVLTLISYPMLSKELIDTDFGYKLGLGFGYSSLSSYFDNDGTERSESQVFRTYNFSDGEFDTSFTVLGNLSYEFVEFHNQYKGKFKLTDKLIGGLGLDLAYYSLDTKFTYNDTLRDDTGEILKDRFGNAQSQKKTVDDDSFSTFRLMYLTPNLKYYILNDKQNKLSATLDAKIPFSFDERSSLKDNIFLDDGHLQLFGGIDYKLISDNTTVEIGGGYLLRNEVYNNMLRADLGIYFTRIENAYFYAKVTYLYSLKDKNEFDFEPTEFAANETMVNMNFGLNVLFEPFELQLDYIYAAHGKNIWITNRLNCTFSLYLQ